MAFAALASGSGCASGTNAGNGNVVYCQDGGQCPEGLVCEGNVCVAPPDAGEVDSDVSEPDIELSAQTLDFQFPLLGEEVTQPLIIHNTGDADLEITQILVDEPGDLQEFHADQEGAVQIVIPPGEDHLLQVSLLPLDGQADAGTLQILSNDPDENPAVVTLSSGHQGTPAVETCVFSEDATPPYPGHPFTECEENADGDSVIDFDVVRFNQPEQRVLSVWNVANGNVPLAIQAIGVSNTTGNASAFSVSYFYQDPATGDATPASLPAFLSAGDTVNTILPDVLYVQVEFDASVDVFPAEQLQIESNAPDTPVLSVDIIGVVTGCPEDYWDINGDPSDGCEYFCEFRQTTEDCDTVGIDDNCNGEIDEEDADHCTVYYRDHDGDSYGTPGDFRCLCDTVGEYQVTNGLDCDDDDQYVRPGVAERCITPYDDNCDGSDNDPGAQGCTNYLRDEDGDTYGVNGDSQCLCYASGIYTSTLPGDCDDDPSACGAACNPSLIEQCSTTHDDNCSGDNNEQDAPGCVTYYRDYDGDGYGHQTLSECWCYPHADYTSTTPTDCDDNNDQIHPTVTEVCDYVDNNCVSGIDEGFNLQSDPQHCGDCDTACSNPYGTTQCVNGACQPSCQEGYGDCNDNPVDGCETNLAAVMFCGSCGSHTDCPSGFFCNGGTCEKKWTLGHTCTDPAQCQSGYCRDGVCCDSDCGGVSPNCRACNLTTPGHCSGHAVNTDPENACALEAASTCGQNGMCDGAGACALHSAGTVCDSETCSGGIHYYQDTCDGFGSCGDGGTEDCSPYTCGAVSCRTSCSTNSHCDAGFYCDGGVCTPVSGLGDTCTSASECSSGFCEDGVCCNTSCTGVCRACDVSGSVGTCIDHGAGTDPEAGCAFCAACNGSGSCDHAVAGTDPKNQCADQRSSNPCGQDGSCDGAGACRYVSNGTVCVSQSCTNHVVTLPYTCDGAGSCDPNGTVNCSPYECLGDSCLSACSSHADCTAGYYCNTSGGCAPVKDPGDACTEDAQCGGGNVCSADGVCCDRRCNGTCESCTAGSVGVCTFFAADTDPDNECGFCESCDGAGACQLTSAGSDPKSQCAESTSSSCGTRDWCNGGGDCAYWAAGTQCGSASCSGDVRNPPPECNGSGSCSALSPEDCAPFTCTSGSCLTTCTVNSHCSGLNGCVEGMCCNTGGSYAGGSCGGGTLDDLDQSSSVVTRWGNVDIGEYHWYKFRAVQDDTTTSSARMSTWVWLSVNPGNAFRFEVRRTPAGVSDCSSPTSECGLSEYFDWFLSGGLEYTSNESKVFYIGVTRTDPASAGHECDPYELSIKVGGSAAPW